MVSEQAPPKKVKKEKPDAVPLPDQKKEKIKKIEEKKQNPEKIDEEIKQVSEFEKDEMFDPNSIAALTQLILIGPTPSNVHLFFFIYCLR